MEFGGNNTPRTRVTRIEVREGKFYEWVGQGIEPKTYDWIHGKLVGIAIREFNSANGQNFVYCDVHLKLDDGTRFCVSTIAQSSITGDIISRLVNVKDYNDVLVFSAWANKGFTNIGIREKKTFDEQGGEKIPWSEIPRPKKIQNGFNSYMDSSERDTVVMRMIEQVNGKLSALGLYALDPGTLKQEPANPKPEPAAGVAPDGAGGYMPNIAPAPDIPDNIY